MSFSERKARRRELALLEDLIDYLSKDNDLSHHVLHMIDLSSIASWEGIELHGALFLGCQFKDEAQRYEVERRGAYVFPRFDGLPYEPYRAHLYGVSELLEGYEEGGYFATRDYQIYAHFDAHRRDSCGVPILEALAQRLHDHAIEDALHDLLDAEDRRHRVLGVMGGHGTSRLDPWYREVALATFRLAQAGYFIASGGGPGIMEAANLGAYLSHYDDPGVIDAALALLSQAPLYSGGLREGAPGFSEAIDRYLATAKQVIDTFGPAASEEIAARFSRREQLPGESLAVPTWFYGHEPSNLFSTHIAKYFANSVREDGLLAISLAGVLYAPGSAGTLQEIFMDLAQNHYTTFVWRSPMIFLDSSTYREWFSLIERFVIDRQSSTPYLDLLTLVDSHEEVVEFVRSHPPRLLTPPFPEPES